MTTLQQIGSTLATGTCVLVASVGLFGVAIRSRHTFVATRCEARPAAVIYNPHPTSASQQRGSPWTGWIGWTLALSYDTMLNGVPGTGTRENGLSGSLLRVNLDGIVLLRFHAVCFRVCCTAAVLFVMLGIPIYLSAQCYTNEQENGEGCGSNAYNLTNYERTTLANVPAINRRSSDDNLTTEMVGSTNDGILWRLYAIVVCFWIVGYHLCHLLHAEWVQVLAMRRVFYLEYDVWGKRREELKQTLLYEEIAAQKRENLVQQHQSHDDYQQQQGVSRNKEEDEKEGLVPLSSPQNTTSGKRFTFENIKSGINYGKKKSPPRNSMAAVAAAANEAAKNHLEPHLRNREPWIPHPEQRDTVPNVALYSILVGGLPSLPEQAADSFNAEATIQFSKRESIDWQLSLTTTFFDHCVPNQPGFSSSVAAVTIIPGALDLSVAWRKWYAAASKLRRLRFIRKQIAARRHFDIEAFASSGEDNNNNNDEDLAKYEYGDDNEYGYSDDLDPDNDEVFVPMDASDDDVSSYLADLPIRRTQPSPDGRGTTPRNIYDEAQKNKDYYRQVLGSALGTDPETHIYDSLEFGPEQASVYAREFAQSAAPCCPNGCNEGRVRRAPIDQLLEMERIMAVEVHRANLELREARRRATRTDSNYNAQSNLHDQQQGQQSPLAVASAHSCLGVTVASPHSCIGGTTTMPTFLPPKTVEEGDENSEEGEDVVQQLQHLPMASRYDRRGSSNANDSKMADRPARLNPVRLGEIAVPGDLDLEAQLYKKSTAESTQKKPNIKSLPADAIIKKPNLKKTPSLEGLEFPGGISLEAK